MLFCRFNRKENPDTCPGCRYGCLKKKPAAYINRDFEEAVQEMETKGEKGKCTTSKHFTT